MVSFTVCGPSGGPTGSSVWSQGSRSLSAPGLGVRMKPSCGSARVPFCPVSQHLPRHAGDPQPGRMWTQDMPGKSSGHVTLLSGGVGDGFLCPHLVETRTGLTTSLRCVLGLRCAASILSPALHKRHPQRRSKVLLEKLQGQGGGPFYLRLTPGSPGRLGGCPSPGC